MAWMTVEAAVGIAAGIVASSIVLIGFGLDSVIEFFAAAVADVAFHPDLVPGMLRDALLAPAADAGDVEFGQSWHLVGVPGGG